MINTRQDCLELISYKLSKTADWRLVQARKYPGDDRNGRAAVKLADFAAEADRIPDEVWACIGGHWNWADEKFGEAVSQTNRNVVFRSPTIELNAYWRSLVANVRFAYEVN